MLFPLVSHVRIVVRSTSRTRLFVLLKRKWFCLCFMRPDLSHHSGGAATNEQGKESRNFKGSIY